MNEDYYPPRLSGFFVFIIVSGIFLSSIVIFFFKPAPVQNPQSENLTPQYSDWKTYTNDKYGFQTQYYYQSPPIETKGTEDIGQFTYLDKVDFGTSPIKSQYGYSVDISKKSLDNFRGELIGHVIDKIDWEEKETINNTVWTKIHYQIFLTTEKVPVTSAFTHHGGYSFIVTASQLDINHTLSTFKFTDKKIDNTSWNTHSDKSQFYSIQYPPEFLISERDGYISIYSPPQSCETENIPPDKPKSKIVASEIKIDIKKLSGTSLSDIWKNEFGFPLTELVNGKIKNNYDGVKTFSGKNGYYFFQGAEMAFGRQAILIDTSPTLALQINSWTPVLIYNCDTPLNKYPGITDQILSTLKFNQVIPTLPTSWKNYHSSVSNFNVIIPTSWKILNDQTANLVVSNQSFNPDLSNGMTPKSGQVILIFGLTHAALENYSSVKRNFISPEGIPVVSQGRYIDASGSFGFTSLYRQNDPQRIEFEKIIKQIISYNSQ